MKRIISLLLCAVIIFLFISCKSKQEVSRVALNHDYVQAFDVYSPITVATYMNGQIVPIIHYMKVHHKESYKVLWKITYDDGEVKEVWETVPKSKYDTIDIVGEFKEEP